MALLNRRGGKFVLARRIVANFPQHTCYVEPFCGACHVLMAKPVGKCEIINDNHSELVNLFRIVKEQPGELTKTFNLCLSSRHYFYAIRDQDPATLDPITRAHRFLMLAKDAFAGNNMTWAFGATRKASFNPDTIGPAIWGMYKRLRRCRIECKDYRELDTYDRTDTLWYLDPPYFGNTSKTYDSIDPCEFIAWVKTLKGKVVISHWRHPALEELDWSVVKLCDRKNYAAGNRETKRAADYEELLFIKP